MRIDALNRLLVHPAETNFDRIYRAAKGIDWDPLAQALVATAPIEWCHLRWFEQILNAVADEYGTSLTIMPTTRWISVTPAVRLEMERFAQGDWRVRRDAQRAKADTVSWRRFQLDQALSERRACGSSSSLPTTSRL